MDPVLAAVAIGSNLGDRAGHVAAALHALASLPETRLLAASRVLDTAPVRTSGCDPGGPYLNAAATLETMLAAPRLLVVLHDVERRLGRDRIGQPHGGARVIDLDLLLYGRSVIALPGLVVPHPGLCSRLFVLEPLAEIAGQWVIPGANRTVAQALMDLKRSVVRSPGSEVHA